MRAINNEIKFQLKSFKKSPDPLWGFPWHLDDGTTNCPSGRRNVAGGPETSGSMVIQNDEQNVQKNTTTKIVRFSFSLLRWMDFWHVGTWWGVYRTKFAVDAFGKRRSREVKGEKQKCDGGKHQHNGIKRN